MIDGVSIVPLRQIVDERGKIMHMMKSTDPHFIKFGEIYFSCAWHVVTTTPEFSTYERTLLLTVFYFTLF